MIIKSLNLESTRSVKLENYQILSIPQNKIWFPPPASWQVVPESNLKLNDGRYEKVQPGWWNDYLPTFSPAFAALKSSFRTQYLDSLGLNSVSVIRSVSEVFYLPKRLVSKAVAIFGVLQQFEIVPEVRLNFL